jgi:hypothetical protein
VTAVDPRLASKPAALPQADSITVLCGRPGVFLAKRIRPNGAIAGYDTARTFDAAEHRLAGMDDLAALLAKLGPRPRLCVVRGALVAGPKARGIRRLLVDDPTTGDTATLRDVPRRWLALDFDSLPCPDGFPVADLQACIDRALFTLPEEFWSGDCVAQATASHGLKPGLRLRLWFWLDRPISGAEAEAWLANAPVDRAIFRAGQLIYTAAPVFEGGAAEHLPTRMLRLPGAPVQVPDNLPTRTSHARRDAPKEAAELAPPSAAEVVALLDRMLNPLETDRGVYVSVMMAARGCQQGLEATGKLTPEGEEAIADAAVRWAERWEGYNGTDERAKWENDFALRDAPLAGWQNLQRWARRLIPDYGEEIARAEFPDLPA